MEGKVLILLQRSIF